MELRSIAATPNRVAGPVANADISCTKEDVRPTLVCPDAKLVATDRVAHVHDGRPVLEELGTGADGRHVFRLTGGVPAWLGQRLNQRFTLTPSVHDGLELRVSDAELPALAKLCRGHVDGVDDAVGVDGPDERYFTVQEIQAYMADLAARFPTMARVMNLSELPGGTKTHGGHSIFALKISKDVRDEVADKPAVVMASQHHSRELNSAVMTLFAMRRLLEGAANGDQTLATLLEEREIYVIPTMNPDGVDTVWARDVWHRKNGRKNPDGSIGVDLNRNYPAGYGEYGASTRPSSQTYQGPHAASEPETQTMIALLRHARPMLYLDFHSSGREVLSLYPPNVRLSREVEAFGRHYADALRAPMDYGYRAPSASGEAPHQYWHEGALAYLVEVGRSFQPDFRETEREEARVWPGILEALTRFRPAAWGHIRGADGTPVAAKIEVVDSEIFSRGEASFSRGQDGRFSLWLPKGTHRIEIRAEGYEPKVIEIKVESYDQPVDLDIELEPARAVLAA